MIFITVGTQEPFDRLIKLMDEWAKGQDVKCFAQIANSKYEPKNIEFKTFLTEQEFTAVFEKATLIISHAGMGTIISSLGENKIILTLPRLLEFKEHRNDHQIATTKAFSDKGFIYPIFNENDLIKHLNMLPKLKPLKKIEDSANIELLDFLRQC